MRTVTHGVFVCCLVLLTTLSTFAAPAQVWVNRAWTGPRDCGEYQWQENAFATIQQGLDAVAVGGTVQVAPGVYPERLTVNRPVTLLGPCACVEPNASAPDDPLAASSARDMPGQEAVVIPPTTDLTLPGGMLVTVNADQVTIDGLVFDGDNPALTDGVRLNQVDVNAAGALGHTARHATGILIAHNIIRNFYRYGVYFNNPDWQVPLTPGNLISYNRFENISVNTKESAPEVQPPVTGVAIRTVRAIYTVSRNTLVDVAMGIDLRTVDQGVGVIAPVIASNRIRAYNVGINVPLYHNRALRGNGTRALVDRNWVRITPRSTADGIFRYGIFVLYIEHDTQLVLSNNDLAGGDAGICLWELPLYDNGEILITGGTIADAHYGIWLRNYIDLPHHGPARVSQVRVTDVTINTPTLAGLCLEDDPRGLGGVALYATRTTVRGGPIGAILKGIRTTLGGNLSLVQQTVDPIRLDSVLHAQPTAPQAVIRVQ